MRHQESAAFVVSQYKYITTIIYEEYAHFSKTKKSKFESIQKDWNQYFIIDLDRKC